MIEKIQKTRLHEIVVKQIVEMIRLGMYQKGDKLPSEKNLCEMYGVSRVTLREALKQLSEMGFIETRQGVGSIIAVDPDDPQVSAHFTSSVKNMQFNFEWTMQARLLLEPMLAFSIAQNASDEDLQALAARFEAASAENIDPTPGSLEDFHLIVAETIHNPLVYDFLAQLRSLENDAPTRTPTLPEKNAAFLEQSYKDHQKILNAILSRQGDMAFLYMREHIRYLSGQFNVFFQTIN